jgi:signal transduction histidine kinase
MNVTYFKTATLLLFLVLQGVLFGSSPVFNALIRKVALINGNIPVFNGYREDNNPNRIHKVFEYKDRNIRFEFAAPFFEDESRTTYSYRLDGYDNDWSSFTTETKKDYTNLGAGTYTFRVQAKNVYGDLSKEAFYKFKVLPPLYLTWWAFLIYAALFFLIVFFIVRWRSWKLVKEKQELEHIIEIRTKEIQEKNLQLETQSEKLKELDEAKSRFFANVSHEFRTPLTLLIGPLEQILSRNPDDTLKSEALMMLRNSHRLLNLVNQLLELARFDSGKIKLQASEQDVVSFVKNIVMCFESLAAHEKINLSFLSEEIRENPHQPHFQCV